MPVGNYAVPQQELRGLNADRMLSPPGVQQAVMPSGLSLPGAGGPVAPPYGLAGSESALDTGLTKSIEAIEGGTGAARRDIIDYGGRARESLGQGGESAQARIDQGVSGYSPYMEGGVKSQQVQEALSGALGPEAQREAYANFQSSPGQEFLTNQAEQALLRNASAMGGLGGGAIRDALQKQAIGYASQDFGNYFDRLGGLSQRGLQAAGGAGNLYGQGAGLAQDRGFAGAQQFVEEGSQLGSLGQSLGLRSADLITGRGRDVSQGRVGAGRDIAANIGATVGGMSDLQAGYGQGTADAINQQTTQLANSFQQAGGDIANDMMGFVNYLMQQGYTEADAIAQAQLARGGTGGKESSAGTVANVFTAFSDIRLKTNIIKLSENNLGPSLYKWNWTEEALPLVGDQPSYGVIAQEIQERQPEAVIQGADGWLRVIYPRINSWRF